MEEITPAGRALDLDEDERFSSGRGSTEELQAGPETSSLSLRATVRDPENREDFDSHIYIHPTADISISAHIGAGSRIWQQVQIRERAVVGQQCVVGKGVYIDQDVMVGDRVKIHNYVTLPQGVMIESGVFIGTNVSFSNDFYPRAITGSGRLKDPTDYDVQCTLVGYGASIGAGAVILPGVRIGSFAMIGAGAVITRDVADHNLVTGNPGHRVGYVCRCGNRLKQHLQPPGWFCGICEETYLLNTLKEPGTTSSTTASTSSASSSSGTAELHSDQAEGLYQTDRAPDRLTNVP